MIVKNTGSRAAEQPRNATADRNMLDALTVTADRLRGARRVTVLTGAGVSAASGVPTFRGASGLWRDVRAEDLATPSAFARDPRLVWEWYDWRRGIVARCAPNRAHEVLAAWSRRVESFALLTQNVDGLHERAGTARVTRLHGSIWTLKCWQGCGEPPWSDDRVPLQPLPPLCPACGGLARPGVVWFGEALDPNDLVVARHACACEVFLVVGTSAVVHPAAGLAEIARSRGAFVAEINPERTEVSAVAHASLRGKAEVVLDALAGSDGGQTAV
jgi:NAD-dependent deacetylase